MKLFAVLLEAFEAIGPKNAGPLIEVIFYLTRAERPSVREGRFLSGSPTCVAYAAEPHRALAYISSQASTQTCPARRIGSIRIHFDQRAARPLMAQTHTRTNGRLDTKGSLDLDEIFDNLILVLSRRSPNLFQFSPKNVPHTAHHDSTHETIVVSFARSHVFALVTSTRLP